MTQNHSGRMRRLVAAGLLPRRAGQPVKARAHMSLAELPRRDGSTALQEEWTAEFRARWAAHRAATSETVATAGRGWRGTPPRLACDAAMAPVVTGDVNPAVLEDLVPAGAGLRRPALPLVALPRAAQGAELVASHDLGTHAARHVSDEADRRAPGFRGGPFDTPSWPWRRPARAGRRGRARPKGCWRLWPSPEPSPSEDTREALQFANSWDAGAPFDGRSAAHARTKTTRTHRWRDERVTLPPTIWGHPSGRRSPSRVASIGRRRRLSALAGHRVESGVEADYPDLPRAPDALQRARELLRPASSHLGQHLFECRLIRSGEMVEQSVSPRAIRASRLGHCA